MNRAELHRKLIAAARRNPPGDGVPLAFEKRITALLQERPAPDPWELWGRALWRGAMACLAVMILFGAVSLFAPGKNAAAQNDFSQDFETTMLSSVDQDADAAFSR
jgi:hypothetical protein